MVAQRNELTTKQFSFNPTTYDEAIQFATIFANSAFCPQSYRGRPNDILTVWEMGREVGLGKMASLRTIACINGMPCIYGDGLAALIKLHKNFEYMEEWVEGSIEKKDLTAFCKIKPKNGNPVIQYFSMNDAIIAGLWDKKDNWKHYPRRMLQRRARKYAATDAIPEAFYNLPTDDEVIDITDSENKVIRPQISNKGISGLKETLGIVEVEAVVEGELIEHPKEPIEPTKLDELKELIDSRKVTKSAITITLKKFGVESIDDLTDEMIDKWSTHLKSKEIK